MIVSQHLDPKYLPDGVTEYGTEGASFSRNPELDLPVGTKVKFPIQGYIWVYGVFQPIAMKVIEVFATSDHGATDGSRGCIHRPPFSSLTELTDAQWTEAIG